MKLKDQTAIKPDLDGIKKLFTDASWKMIHPSLKSTKAKFETTTKKKQDVTTLCIKYELEDVVDDLLWFDFFISTLPEQLSKHAISEIKSDLNNRKIIDNYNSKNKGFELTIKDNYGAQLTINKVDRDVIDQIIKVLDKHFTEVDEYGRSLLNSESGRKQRNQPRDLAAKYMMAYLKALRVPRLVDQNICVFIFDFFEIIGKPFTTKSAPDEQKKYDAVRIAIARQNKNS